MLNSLPTKLKRDIAIFISWIIFLRKIEGLWLDNRNKLFMYEK